MARFKAILAKLLYWVVFGVVFGTLPLTLSLFTGRAEQVFGQGELLISSVAISATAIGELLIQGNKRPNELLVRSIVGGACILVAIFSTATFVLVPFATPLGLNIELYSTWLFGATVVSSGAAVALVAG